VDFVEICNVCARKVIIKAAKRIFNSDKICCSYYDFYFGVTFLEHTVVKYNFLLGSVFKMQVITGQVYVPFSKFVEEVFLNRVGVINLYNLCY